MTGMTLGAVAWAVVYLGLGVVPALAQGRVSLFSQAVMRGDYARVEAMLRHDPGLVRTRDRGHGRGHLQLTPLHWAALFGRTRIAGLLIRFGADANAREAGGSTALMYAATRGNLGVVKALLAAGARINDKNRSGQTATYLAEINGQPETYEYLMRHGGWIKGLPEDRRRR